MSVRRMPNLVVDHHDLALGDQGAVHQHIHGLAGQAVELDHRAVRELQQVTDRQLGALSSAVICTGMSRIMSKSLSAPGLPGRRIPRRAGWQGGPGRRVAHRRGRELGGDPIGFAVAAFLGGGLFLHPAAQSSSVIRFSSAILGSRNHGGSLSSAVMKRSTRDA